MSLTIRPAKAEDIDAIAALYEDADRDASRLLPRFFRPPTEFQRSTEALEDKMNNIDTALLVAQDARGVLGLVMAVMQPSPPFDGFVPRRYAVVEDLVVDPKARREGIGSRLIEEAETWALKQGADSVDLTVVEGNSGAQELYRRSGYEMRSHRMWKRFT